MRAAVFAQPFAIDRLQDVLFVIESYDELFAALDAATSGRMDPVAT